MYGGRQRTQVDRPVHGFARSVVVAAESQGIAERVVVRRRPGLECDGAAERIHGLREPPLSQEERSMDDPGAAGGRVFAQSPIQIGTRFDGSPQPEERVGPVGPRCAVIGVKREHTIENGERAYGIFAGLFFEQVSRGSGPS